jgi:hypothetical protein
MCENCKSFEPKSEIIGNLTEIRKMTWQEAVDWAESLGEDWVLPTRWQLQVMYRAYELGHPELQDMKGKYFWSSSTFVYNTYFAWYVHFNYGLVGTDSKTDSNYVRCVRRGFLDSLVLWVLKNDKE